MSRVVWLLAGPAMVVSAGAAAAKGDNQAVGLASARVISPVAVRELADLDFGTISSAGSGAVSLAPGQNRPRYTGGAGDGCAGSRCPAPHLASFAVSGEALRGYTISIPVSLIAGGLAAGAQVAPPALVVDTFSVRSASRPHAGHFGQLDDAGRDTFELGGRVRVPANLPPARYRVSVPVIVTYS